jgi:uncharacterized membrane protein/secreted protein with Ig-like and vWFA domain
MQIVKPSKRLAVIFALDVSNSVPQAKQQEAIKYIKEALQHKRENDYMGLIVFGSDASVELAPDTSAKLDRIYSVPSKSYTDIAQGIGLAIASFPADASKRIVLLSDGNENLGKALDQATMAETEGIEIDTVPLANDVKQETLLDSMVAPSEIKIGEPFELKVIAESKGDAHGQIRLLRNGQPVDTKLVSLSPGKNVLSFQQTADKPGVYSYDAYLESDADTNLENNHAISTTLVRGKPRVLYVEGKPGQSGNLAKALSASDIVVDVKNASGIPASMDELRNYDSVIMSDIPAMAMTPDQMKLLEAGVRDLGVGFGMVGGDNSFGAGGYFNTPIERTLPVDMSIRKQKVLPSLSVVIVIDKSGSMGAMEDGRTKIDLANEAAVNVVRLLQPIDNIGIIFCHDHPVVVVPMTKATNKNGVQKAISTINAEGGGIMVFQSLKEAYRIIAGSGTRQKHVIMLCDGADCDDQDGAVSLAGEMKRKGITVTSVAIGDGKDVSFMKDMSRAGGGNFYLAQKARELPYIFTKDVMLVSKSLIVEEPFIVRADPNSQVLSGIDWSSSPPLLGYVSASPKPMADVPMISHKEDPIYAQWQYGLGRSIAFTSDAKARWAVRWLDWPGYTKFWAQSVRWSLRRTRKADFQSAVTIDAAVGRVVVDAVDPEGRFINGLKLEGRLISPHSESKKLQLEQTAPGRYEAEFPARDVGTYTVNVIEKYGKEVTAQACSVTIPYPPEYRDIRTNRRLLERLASVTGGKVGPQPSDVFVPNVKKARVPSDLWWMLALIGILMFPLDVAVRRLAMDLPEFKALAVKILKELKARIPGKKHSTANEKASVESVGRLLESKKSRKPAEERPEWARPQPLTTPKQDDKPREEQKSPPKPTPEPKDTPPPADTTSRLLEAKRKAREKRD